MRDLWLHEDDLILATHGRSIWILDDISRLRQLAGAPGRDALLFRPSAAYRMHRSTWTDTPIPPDEPLAENPPAGAIIEYWLPHDARQPLVLEVLDASGAAVRRYRSDDPPQPDADELARELIPPYWIKPPQVLSARAGAHRWVWDLHYPAPVSVARGYPISAVPHATPQQPQGPLALPGTYRVRISYEGQHLEAPLTLKADPRVSASAEALAEQLRLTSHLADLLTQSSQALLAAQSQEAQLKSVAPGAADSSVHSYLARLATLTGSAPLTGATAEPAPSAPNLKDLEEQIAGLYAELMRADAAPTTAQRAATEELQGKLAGPLESWKKLQADLPELNRQLHAAKRTAVRTDLPPPRDPNLADEE
ncbi:MAG: hypothetical protein JO158_01205 [Gammaproteobacteria bacterium]|nr:hypothetical protein [Gammaproteobacteria bacterium]